MITHHQVRDVLEYALHEHGPDAHALARAVTELVPLQHHTATYAGVLDVLRPLMWPPPRCAWELAALRWRALPLIVR